MTEPPIARQPLRNRYELDPVTGKVSAAVDLSVPPEVVTALHALNQHARAYGCGKRAIYAYKTLVAALLVAAGEASAQLVQWTGTCGHCRGTGRYVDSYGEKWPHCRQCSSTGQVTLKFVETALPDGVVWHHPWDRYDAGGREIADIAGLAIWDGERGRYRSTNGTEPVFWNITSGWSPRQPAETLLPDDTAARLNTVEAWVVASNFPHIGRNWLESRALDALRGYVLDLGRIGGLCWYCESHEISCGLSLPGPPFAWSAPVCREHQQLPVSLWPTVFPEWVMTPPLVEWKRRHDALGFHHETIFGWM